MKQSDPCPVFRIILAAGLLAAPLATFAVPTPIPATTPYSGNFTFSGNLALAGEYTSDVNPSATGPFGSAKSYDWGAIFTPSAELDYFDNKGNAVSVGGNYSLLWFDRNPQYNTQLGTGSISFAHGQVDPLAANPVSGNLAANAYGAYSQSIDTSPDAAGLGLSSFLVANQIIANANLGYRFRPVYIEGGFNFDQTNYNYTGDTVFRPIFDTRGYTIPVHAYYLLNKSIALGAAYALTEVDNYSRSGTASGNRLQLNNVGAFSLKTAELPLFGWGNLTGLVELGGVNSEAFPATFPIASSHLTTVYYNVDLNYEHRFSNVSTLDFDISGQRNVEVGVSSLSYVTTTSGLFATYHPAASWYVQATLINFGENDYQSSPRVDRTYNFGVALTKQFKFNAWIFRGLDVSLAYNYTDNKSNFFGADYSQNVISLTGTIPFDAP
jgi:hypothetical protein